MENTKINKSLFPEMINVQMLLVVYELKGIIDSYVSMADRDGDYDHPGLDDIQKKVNELVACVNTSGEINF